MAIFRRQFLAAAFALSAFGSVGVSNAAAEPKTVAIANFGEHPILNTVVDGFKAEILASGMVEGKDVVFTLDHVNFDTTLIPQMIAKIEATKPALVLTISTPVSQNFKNQLEGTGIPMVFAAVTDPVAGGLVPSADKSGPSMTGVSDAVNVEGVMLFTRKLLPNAKKLGVPFNPGEANDVATVAQFTQHAAKYGFEIAEVGVDSPNDIQPRVAALAAKVDVVYGLGSSLIQPAIAAVVAATNEAKIPLINNNTNMVDTGIIPAAVGVGYEKHGHMAGKIAVRILKGEKPSDILPAYPTPADQSIMISRKAMERIGITIPESLADCGCIVD
ncbi:MAG TPA: ABC transporter [Agrobacterium sp.]|uniref:ABC transporter substrate-binding protein n=1 Tax=Agrobacterium pusense TaxID=648995 RepID=UPI000E8C279F|nr:ABC transporter [Agrobacterium sp.]